MFIYYILLILNYWVKGVKLNFTHSYKIYLNKNVLKRKVLIVTFLILKYGEGNGGNNMNLVKDEKGQGAAEYILLFGGVIVIAIAALLIYSQYFSEGGPFFTDEDLHIVRENVASGG